VYDQSTSQIVSEPKIITVITQLENAAFKMLNLLTFSFKNLLPQSNSNKSENNSNYTSML
jgi:hypothetical protein